MTKPLEWIKVDDVWQLKLPHRTFELVISTLLCEAYIDALSIHEVKYNEYVKNNSSTTIYVKSCNISDTVDEIKELATQVIHEYLVKQAGQLKDDLSRFGDYGHKNTKRFTPNYQEHHIHHLWGEEIESEYIKEHNTWKITSYNEKTKKHVVGHFKVMHINDYIPFDYKEISTNNKHKYKICMFVGDQRPNVLKRYDYFNTIKQ